MSNLLQIRLDAIKDKRSKAKPLLTAVAPSVSSYEFRTCVKFGKPKARRWDDHFNTESTLRKGATLKLVSSTQNAVDTISLGTGRPDSQYYPWTRMTFESPMLLGSENGPGLHSTVPTNTTKESSGLNLALALNYGFAAGSAQILRFITEHIELLHDPPYEDWETCLTCGTTSALDILFRMFLERGEPLIVEEYTYTGAIEAARALGLELISIEMDEEGLSSQDLDKTLGERSATGQKIPSIMYTIPCGHNPTGVTQSSRRKKAIYQIAEQYNVIIIEDDPYHLLQLGPQSVSIAGKSMSEEYIDRLSPSFLSIDTSGRVIRLETASKILAPGLRCGWLTASSQIVKKFISHTDASTGSVSGPTQLMLFSLLEQSWGHAGFLCWLDYLSAQYRTRRNKLLECCLLYLPLEICRWSVPTEGMFLWIELRLSQTVLAKRKPDHDISSVEQILNIEDEIYDTARAAGVIISKGSWFWSSPHRVSNDLCFRLTFAAAPIESFDLAVKRFGDAIRQVLPI